MQGALNTLRSYAFMRFAQGRVFWTLRATSLRYRFGLRRKVFLARSGFQEERRRSETLVELGKVVLPQLVVAVAMVALLQLTEDFVAPLATSLGVPTLNEESYSDFMSTVAGVGGVFIGLYYAAIATVGAALYTQVPNDVRGLLAQERVGTVYMRFLAFLTFSCLCFVALRVNGYAPIHVATPIVAVLSGIGILAFIRLGQRAFYLFDPTMLSSGIFESLSTSFRRVQCDGSRAFDPSFQHHAYTEAERSMEALEVVGGLVAKSEHLGGQSFVALCSQLMRFLVRYDEAKGRIPWDSRWYEQKYRHPDWYRSSDTNVNLAHRAGLNLNPEIVAEREWIENRALAVLEECVRANLDAQRFGLLPELFKEINTYLEQVAGHAETSFALDVVARVAKRLLPSLVSVPVVGTVPPPIQMLGAAEWMAGFPISSLIGFVKSLDRDRRAELLARLAVVTWAKRRAVYDLGARGKALESIERLHPRMDFERRVLGERVTPDWFIADIVLQAEAEQFKNAVEGLFRGAMDLYDEWITLAERSKHIWFLAVIVGREWEYWDKLLHHLPRIGDAWLAVRAGVKHSGLVWPEINFDALRESAETRRGALLTRMSRIQIALGLVARPDEYPDYAGRYLHAVGEAIMAALRKNDAASVASLFPAYFAGCVLQFQQLRPREVGEEWRAQIEIKIAMAPLFDLMDVSGYARFYAELHSNPDLSASVDTTWDTQLSQREPVDLVRLLSLGISIAEGGFEIPHRAILRTAWGQGVARDCAQLGRRYLRRRSRPPAAEVADHASALVRLLAQDYGTMMYDGVDIFLTLYLKNHPSGSEVDIGRKRVGLQKALEREERDDAIWESERTETAEADQIGADDSEADDVEDGDE